MYEYGAYDRWLDRKWDEYCESLEPRDGVYKGLVRIGPLLATVKYEMRRGEPVEVLGVYLEEAWCPRTLRSEMVEISESLEISDRELLASVNPSEDDYVCGLPDDDYDGPDEF